VISGLDSTHDRVRSLRRDHELSTGLVSERRGLYPEGARASSLAAFAKLVREGGPLHVELGGRVSRHEVRLPPAEAFGETDITPTAVVGRAVLGWNATPGLRLYGAVARAFRAPNVNDLSTLGAFDFGVEVPARDLRPERALGFEWGLKYRADSVRLSAALYRTELTDLIERVPASYQGVNFYEGQRVYRRTNVGRAFVQGAEGAFEWRLPGAALTSFGHLTYTFGRLKDAPVPLRRIPPLNGELGLTWGHAGQARADLRVRFAASQRRLSPGDVADHRIAPGGTPGWHTLNLRLSRPLGDSVEFSAGIENLFDVAYRMHGSGVDGYGRHVWLSARVRF